jgi:hypothetical protein
VARGWLTGVTGGHFYLAGSQSLNNGHYGKFGLPIEHRLPRDAVNCARDGHYTISGIAYLHDLMSIDQLPPRIPPSLTSQVAVTIRDVTAREMPLVKEDESP